MAARSLTPCGERDRACALRVGGPQPPGAAGALAQLGKSALVDDPALADDRHPVAELFHLGEQVAGEQDGDPLAGEPANEQAHVAHPRRIETGGRLVQKQQPRRAQQRGGDPEPLLHPVRVAADPVVAPVAQLDQLEHLLDPVARARLVVVGKQAQVPPAGQVRVEAPAPRRSRRHRQARAPPGASGSRPNSSIAPAVGRISPSSIRSEVVFPAPFGPR